MEFVQSQRMSGVSGSIIRELFKLTAAPDMISFAGGNPSPEAFPTREIADIAYDALSNRGTSMLQYGLSEGYPPLRNEVKRYLKEKYGFPREEDDTLIVSGGQQCADLTAKILLNEGDGVICEELSFVGVLNTLRSYGAKLTGVPMESDGMNLEALKKAMETTPRAKLLYIIPNFQNPTGFTTSWEKRKAIYAMAKEHGLFILEDDPYGELRFEGDPVPPIKSLDTEGIVIHAGSFSKTMAPAFRLGFITANKALIARLVVAKQCTDVHSTTLFQEICYRYMTEHDYAGHIAMVSRLYGEKCECMLSNMEKYFHPSVRFNRPQGGLFVTAFLPEGMDAYPFVTEGIRRKVACVPGVAFVMDPTRPSNAFRMNYSMPTMEQIETGIRILGQLTWELLDK
ncbi:MAG: PLP-dependent aminotransferase family protein [Eubacteriales bacterium]|nr:PLP-dependent aminotransferase family protein [Eubacteriales bacterium]